MSMVAMVMMVMVRGTGVCVCVCGRQWLRSRTRGAAHHLVLDVQVRPGLHQHPDGVGLAIITGDHQGRQAILHSRGRGEGEDEESGVSMVGMVMVMVRGTGVCVCVCVVGSGAVENPGGGASHCT